MFTQDNIISLSADDQDRLFLTWLAYTNFKMLKDNQESLKRTWQKLRGEIFPYFRKYNRSLEQISKDFGKITITNDPAIAYCFDSDRIALEFNVLNLFFSSCPSQTKGDFVAVLPWKLGGQLVHEHDHYLWYKEHDLISKTKKEADEFYEKHIAEIESRAFRNQIAFLENAKDNLPISSFANFIRVECWTTNGEPILSDKSYSYMLSKHEAIDQIDQSITCFSDLLETIDKHYTENGNTNNRKISLKMLRILGLNSPNKSSNDYDTLELEM